MTAYTPLGPTIKGTFGQLYTLVKQARDQDTTDGKAERERIDEEEGWCDDDQANEFIAEGETIMREMDEALASLESTYNTKLDIHDRVPQRLSKVATETYDAAVQQITPILQDMAQRQAQNHWKGGAADAYMKQLPTQVAAVTEFNNFMEALKVGVTTPAMIQQGILMTFSQTLTELQQTISNYVSRPRQKNVFFHRSYPTRSAIKQVISWTDRELLGSYAYWKSSETTHVSSMTSSRVTSPEVIKADKWPHATGDTPADQVPTPPTMPVVTPPTAPGTTETPDIRDDHGGVDSDQKIAED